MMQHEPLIKQIMDGVRLFAFRHSRDPDQAKDFLQEGLIAALMAIEKYAEKPPEELCKILSRCAQNRILDLQRSAVTYFRNTAPLEELDFVRGEPFDDRCERESVIRVISDRLSATAKRVFKERLDPSWQTENAFLEDKILKRRRRDRGELVMGAFSETIRDTHIANGLGVSKATVSRAAKEIEHEGRIVLNNQEAETVQS